VTGLELEWGWETLQPFSFCEYVSVWAKPRATRLLKLMQRSRPVGLPRLFFPGGALVVTGIPRVSQSAVAIELARRQQPGRSQILIEEIC